MGNFIFCAVIQQLFTVIYHSHGFPCTMNIDTGLKDPWNCYALRDDYRRLKAMR